MQPGRNICISRVANTRLNSWGWLWLVLACLFHPVPAPAQIVINEILLNPPGPDAPNEYIELRGTPNQILAAGTYLVAVEGDAGGNPGTIQNIFDLSGQRIGGDGFLVLLQKNNTYQPNSNATVLVHNGPGTGWGSGSSSTVNHRGEGGQTDLENASATFFLIESPGALSVGDDIDADDNGTPDGALFASWTVRDSVGVLDSDGAGDFAYAAINFRSSSSPGNGAGALGTVVPVSFSPGYVGRTGNTIGSAATDWVASDNLTGAAPNWTLGLGSNTSPTNLSVAALSHLGAPNFGAPPIPGVLLRETAGSTAVIEGETSDSYTLALNTAPTGSVTLRIECGPPLEVSTNNGVTFNAVATLTFTDTQPQTVLVRASNDNVVEVSPRQRFITNSILMTADAVQYPLTSLIPAVAVAVADNDVALLNELKVNPPGTNDGPFEFIEIIGPPGATLTNVQLLALNGNTPTDPGTVNYSLDLSGKTIGPNGLLVVVATNPPYTIPAGTAMVADPTLNLPAGALDNGTISFLLVAGSPPIPVGTDLDNGDNGVLEGLPAGAVIMDAVGWSDGDNNDIVYGGVALSSPGTPDAATRFPGNLTPNSAAAWFSGELLQPNGDAIAYDPDAVSGNFPPDSTLTPGDRNNTAPTITGLVPISGVIGDPTNPTLTFTVGDGNTPASNIVVTATSSNAGVVPSTNLLVTSGNGGTRTLSINPVGVGYSTLTIMASDGSMTRQVPVAYAASAPGRPGGVWHLGASDGSTAMAVDANHMFVGDDENQSIRLYRRHESGLLLSAFDMTPYLALPDVEAGQVREVDIEASTRVGNRLFWLGSHSHANIGETRTNRTRLWATDLSGSGSNSVLTYVGRYDYLKVDLIAWDQNNVHGNGTNYYGIEASDAEGVEPKAPDGSGFSIEGLAMLPGSSTSAYVAFRAPIVPATNRNFALIVPVLNFSTVAIGNSPPGSAIFGAPIEMDLYGRGIRSLEGDTNGYLLVGGPAAATPANYPQDFRLYTWTGNPGDKPQQRAADLSGLNPEGIVALPPTPWNEDTQIELLSDNGQTAFYGDGVPAKSLPIANFKKSRSDLVTLGAVVKPAPIVTAATRSGTNLTITWRSLAAETYRVQTTTNLAPANWVDVAGDVPSSGPYASKVIISTSTQLFCRVQILP